jgi:hypothetical protein
LPETERALGLENPAAAADCAADVWLELMEAEFVLVPDADVWLELMEAESAPELTVAEEIVLDQAVVEFVLELVTEADVWFELTEADLALQLAAADVWLEPVLAGCVSVADLWLDGVEADVWLEADGAVADLWLESVETGGAEADLWLEAEADVWLERFETVCSFSLPIFFYLRLLFSRSALCPLMISFAEISHEGHVEKKKKKEAEGSVFWLEFSPLLSLPFRLSLWISLQCAAVSLPTVMNQRRTLVMKRFR